MLVAVGTLIPCLLLFFPGKKRIERLEGKGCFDAAGSMKKAWDILKCRQFWVFFAAMFVAGGGEFGATFWCASLLRLDYNASPWIGGLAPAVFSAGMMIGRTGSGVLISQKNLPKLVMIAAVCGAILFCFFTVMGSIVSVMILLFFVGLASAPFWPSVQSYSVDRLEHLDSTTLYIMLSCAGVPGCGCLSWIMGKAGDLWGLRTAFLAVPICYLILAGLIAFDYYVCKGRKHMQSNKEINQA